jgi:acetyl-CoA acyltransferase
MKKPRVAIVEGIRTPFCKAGGVFRDIEADDLGAFIVAELLARTGAHGALAEALVFGNVIQPPPLANIARIIAVKGGVPINVPAMTVNRNCASGLEAISTASDRILLGHYSTAIAGGAESMTNFPISIKKKYRDFLQKFMKAKDWKQRLGAITSFRPSHVIPDFPEISDPICGLSMGQTAEVLVRDFAVSREEQDRFAMESQKRASEATAEGRFAKEIAPIPVPPGYATYQQIDDGPRANQTYDALAKLRPSFDPITGTVTAGNSSQLTDGAAALLLMSEEKAKDLGITPLGYFRDHAESGLDPRRMGLGPAYAMAKLLKATGMKLSDFDLIEINEAFAAQVLAVVKACSSDQFSRTELGLNGPLGDIDMQKLNVNGGAIALGHPLGASGARLVITILNELKRRKKNLGLVSLCIGGGQGQAAIVEVV